MASTLTNPEEQSHDLNAAEGDAGEAEVSATAQSATVRQLTVLVPAGAKPGVTLLRVDPGDGKHLQVIVPGKAKAGDALSLTETGPGQWTCRMATYYIDVPPDCAPGETQLRVKTMGNDGEELLVTVPRQALPGDKLRLDCQNGPWTVMVVRELGSQQTMLEVDMPRLELDSEARYWALVEAARNAGAMVSDKIGRGRGPPPLCLMGMVVTDAVEAGEELLRIPGRMVLCLQNYELMLPDVVAAVRATPLPPGHATQGCEDTSFVTILNRAKERLLTGAPPAEHDGPYAAIWDVWDRYAEAVLAEDFSSHPHACATLSPQDMADVMAPSQEPAEAKWQSGQSLAICNIVREHVPAEALGDGGPTVEAGMFLHAHISVMSRAFTTARGSALVPVTDFANHAVNPGASWVWEDEGDAHVCVATRAHQAGEELTISYGNFANPLLFRGFGFTLPPGEEPNWAFLVQKVRPADVFEQYLPAHMSNHVLHFCTELLRESMVDAFNGCVEHGTSAEDFLTAVLDWAMPPYREDPALEPALKALDAARAEDPAGCAWWEYLGTDEDAIGDSGAAHLGAQWPVCMVRVKMSEYLCLTVYREVLEVLAGRLTEERCIARAAKIRDTLLSSFRVFRDGEKGTRLRVTRRKADECDHRFATA